MSRTAHRRAIATALILAAAAAAGCGSTAPASPTPAAVATLPAPPLDTSLATATGTWAVAVMGGPAAQHNNFWQLFSRPGGSTRWNLATPPGVADNGGLVLSGGGPPLIAGFRPSRYLTYSPLAGTRDGGRTWSSLGPIDGALADVPDALAIQPGNRRMLALLTSGTAELAAAPYTRWNVLTTRRTLAATPAGRSCRLQAITASTFSPSGMPLLAGGCAHPGTAGIFALKDGTWRAAGPAVPAGLAHQDITVLRLTQTGHSVIALLAAGIGRAASLAAAWSADDGGHWALSPALSLGEATPAAASFGPGGAAAIVMTGDRGEVIAGAGSRWRLLPALPPGTVTLAQAPGGTTDALAVHRTTLTVWQLPPHGTGWTKTQVISVPIQFGSSG